MRVLTLGTFDLFHPGHVYLLRRAAEEGAVSVGVNSDRFVSEYKGRMPAESEEKRLKTVKACRFVEQAFINDGPGDLAIRLFKPSVLVIGSDWLDRDYLAQIDMTRAELDELRCDVLFVARQPGFSTTALREAA